MRNAEIHSQRESIARPTPMNPYYINVRRIADHDWYQLPPRATTTLEEVNYHDHFPWLPRLLKGAIVGLDPVNPLASVIVFQYNPDTLTRRLEARAMGGGEGSDPDQSWRLCDANAIAIQTLKLENEGWERDLDVVESAELTFTEPPA